MLPFTIHRPATNEVPVLVSVPHCGVMFPDSLKEQYKPDLASALDDTDWFVDQLYDFAPVMGITMITAVYHRWVIDLNRDPQSNPLYSDGRIITGLCPTTDFLGNPIYNDHRLQVSNAEVANRLNQYYWPYHEQLQALLNGLKARHGNVLLWDCHSIRQFVPSIQKEKFSDLILGSVDGTSASAHLVQLVLQKLRQSSFTVSLNHPFKGGFITRNYGNPSQNFHALQLEMSKINYMDDAERKYDHTRAEKVRDLLKSTLGALAEKISA